MLRPCHAVRVIALVAFATLASAAWGEPKIGLPPQAKSEHEPPFSISGFKYSFMPPSIHMFVCEAEHCQPGAKVSYLLLSGADKTSFAEYRSRRKTLETALAEQLRGIDVRFEETVDKSDQTFTIFESTREEKPPQGPSNHVRSTRLFGKTFGVDLISSSASAKVTEENSNVFMLAVMTMVIMGDEQVK
jgi:hypothetical protein